MFRYAIDYDQALEWDLSNWNLSNWESSSIASMFDYADSLSDCHKTRTHAVFAVLGSIWPYQSWSELCLDLPRHTWERQNMVASRLQKRLLL